MNFRLRDQSSRRCEASPKRLAMIAVVCTDVAWNVCKIRTALQEINQCAASNHHPRHVPE